MLLIQFNSFLLQNKLPAYGNIISIENLAMKTIQKYIEKSVTEQKFTHIYW